jgi:hypothetical protein
MAAHAASTAARRVRFCLILATLATLGWAGDCHTSGMAMRASFSLYRGAQTLEEARQHAPRSVFFEGCEQANYQLDRLNRMLRLAREPRRRARQERVPFAMAVSLSAKPLYVIIGSATCW